MRKRGILHAERARQISLLGHRHRGDRGLRAAAAAEHPRVDVDHEELKSRIALCEFAIRTGERTPYVNVILESGVPL